MSERDDDVLRATAMIVGAYLRHHAIERGQLEPLIREVFAALRPGRGPPPEPEREPAVPVRRSVRPEHLVCLECGKAVKVLKRHLGVEHDLSPEAYRARWGLPPDYPLVAPAYAQRRAELARESGLGRKQPAPPPPPPPEPAPRARRRRAP